MRLEIMKESTVHDSNSRCTMKRNETNLGIGALNRDDNSYLVHDMNIKESVKAGRKKASELITCQLAHPNQLNHSFRSKIQQSSFLYSSSGGVFRPPWWRSYQHFSEEYGRRTGGGYSLPQKQAFQSTWEFVFVT